MTTTTRRRFAASVAALGLAAVLGACATPDAPAGSTGAQSPSATGTAGAAAHNAADIAFAQAMIEHHEGAVAMSELARERASDDRVRDLAERIAAAQGPEIELMSGWLEAWGEDGSGGTEHGGGRHDAPQMDGMDHQEAMASLSELEGAEFDRRFLELMVAHHRGAVDMAEANADDGQDAEARELGRSIVEDQTREITEMEDLLAVL